MSSPSGPVYAHPSWRNPHTISSWWGRGATESRLRKDSRPVAGALRYHLLAHLPEPHLRARLIVEQSAQRLSNFFQASTELMQVMARGCGHRHVNEFSLDDLTTWKREMSHLTGISYGGASLD